MYCVICVVYVRATADLPPRVLRLSGGQEVVGAVHQGIAVVQFYTMTLQGISIVVRYVGVWWGNRNPTNNPTFPMDPGSNPAIFTFPACKNPR